MDLDLIKFLPWVPLLGALLCGLCCIRPAWRGAAGPISVVSLLIAFALSIGAYFTLGDGTEVVHAFNWIRVGDFTADFSYYIDPLTIVMLFVVTGIGSLVALYATGYMAGDRGYARFFAAVGLFIFAMTSMVMGDNLIVLFLGWEGVGLASYLLIGYYYEKPSAVAAAKKAFIVNRIGDMGFAIGIFAVYLAFGSVRYEVFLPAAKAMIGSADVTTLETAARIAYDSAMQHQAWVTAAPLLLLLGAIGKSAQLPLYVWLPDAMEGPSPVSALIHAATMVTSGVYMVSRLIALFEYSQFQVLGVSMTALSVVAAVGGLTAIFAATIALCQNDIKRVFAYSTVSQLGYMFLGVGVFSTVGGMWHLISHAFFKGLLFLTAGSVMHAMAGQLDLRKMSGLRHKMPVTCWLMFAGCLALAGFPFTSGFFSKDLIIAAVFDRAQMPGANATGYYLLGIAALVTAFITASYGFRVWFRIFMGPEQYEMGTDNHAADPVTLGTTAHGHEAHPEDVERDAAAAPHHAPAHAASEHTPDHHHEPHEMPWWPMNLPLAVLAIGALASWLVIGVGEHYGWIGHMVSHSTANPSVHPDYGTLFGMNVHTLMMIVSGSLAILAILLAAYLHWLNRGAVAKLAAAARPIVTLLANKYYIDEIYDAVIVRPLRTLGYIFFVTDQLLINGIVYGIAWIPRLMGKSAQRTQQGVLQGYGLGMVLGIAAIALIVFIALANPYRY